MVNLAVTDWPDLPVETSGDPHAMAQAEQDALGAESRAGARPLRRPRVPAIRPTTFTHTAREAARIVFLNGLWPAALAIWGEADAAPSRRHCNPKRALDRRCPGAGGTRADTTGADWRQEAHARGLVVGAVVHAFNRWQWAEADFMVDGATVHAPLDGLAVRYGNGAARRTKAVATTPSGYQVLDRQRVVYPPTQNNNAMVGSYTSVGQFAEIVVDAGSGRSTCSLITPYSSAATCWCRSWCRARSKAG